MSWGFLNTMITSGQVYQARKMREEMREANREAAYYRFEERQRDRDHEWAIVADRRWQEGWTEGYKAALAALEARGVMK